MTIKWTPDCQGKWDYDGPLVSVSTRYWPRGGGFHVVSPEHGWQSSAEIMPHVKPSATSHILLGDGDDAVDLATADFEGDTESEVKEAVERWVASQFEQIRAALSKG